eukprot:3480193-Pyramimonas_sp.AAC.3
MAPPLQQLIVLRATIARMREDIGGGSKDCISLDSRGIMGGRARRYGGHARIKEIREGRGGRHT